MYICVFKGISVYMLKEKENKNVLRYLLRDKIYIYIIDMNMYMLHVWILYI
jgi:hypothetical protein